MSRIRGVIFEILAVCFLAVNVFAQDVPPPPLPPIIEDNEEVRIDTQLVDVPISVTDKEGKPILDLKRENFAVFEDGKKQEIVNFFAADEAFEAALLLDTSGSTRAELRLIKRAAQLFIDSLREGDRVAIISFNTATAEGSVVGRSTSFPVAEVVTGLTSERSVLSAALDKVGTSNGTPYYDSLLKVAGDVFRNPASERFRGRRALVALTDGVDSTSDAGFEEASEEIAKTGIATYFVHLDTQQDFEDGLLGDCYSSTQFSKAQLRRYYNLFPKEFKIERVLDFCKLGDFERLDISKRLYSLAADQMAGMAKASGGKVFPVADLREARLAFRNVASEIGTSYSIGYYSTNTEFDGTYRKIRVEIKGLPAGSILRAREGYTAPVK
ncbi:MAG: VWA domain-containing protein [Pyrinomonadaceae bacterium]|nr:VWA domain-containing protein [Pyrinomonadaceae bacterium]